MAAPPPPPRGGMSLYANLLDPKAADASASISSAPVLYGSAADKDDEATKREAANAALRFQPIRRPQLNQKKPTKPSFPKAIPPSSTTSSSTPPAAAAATSVPPPPTGAPSSRTLADWTAVEEEDYIYNAASAPRQRGGRRKNKKKRGDDRQFVETDWDELYDPARPTNVEEYMRSDERIREVQEWKAVLYAHRRRKRSSYGSEEDSDGDVRPGLNNQFAPPGNFSFAPPPQSPPARRRNSPAAVPAPEETAEEAYARRLALSGQAPPPPPPPESSSSALPPPPPGEATISRGPVRYEAPPQPPAAATDEDDAMDVDEERPAADDTDAPTDPDAPRSLRPGQAGFAQRLMSKYGWKTGSGLGADSSGILNPLQVKVEKRRKRPDSEGGGFVDPAGRGKIVGGRRPPPTQAEQDEGKGAMSEVIVLRNMLEGMDDLQGEITNGGLGQEIGEECGDKYGRVERLYIDVGARLVFIKFTDQVSALRAVNALEGRVFNGNAILAKFYDTDKFEKGIYI